MEDADGVQTSLILKTELQVLWAGTWLAPAPFVSDAEGNAKWNKKKKTNFTIQGSQKVYKYRYLCAADECRMKDKSENEGNSALPGSYQSEMPVLHF